MLPLLTLVLGGAASGKSAFAEGLVVQSGRPRLYIATGQASDPEMRARIARHIAARGAGWETVEAPLAVAEAITAANPGSAILLDCATLWLGNLMFAERDAAGETARLLVAIAATPVPVVVCPTNLACRRCPTIRWRGGSAMNRGR